MTASSWEAKGEKKHDICIQKEKAHKNMESPLCWKLLGIRTALECGWQTQGHSIGANWFFLFQQVLVTNNFWLGVGPWARFASLCWDFVGMKRVQVLCVLSQSLCVHVYSSPFMSLRSCFFEVNHHLWLLQCFRLLFCIYSWGLRRRIWKWSHLGLTDSRSFALGTLPSCESPC